jgi:hypothetical protein
MASTRLPGRRDWGKCSFPLLGAPRPSSCHGCGLGASFFIPRLQRQCFLAPLQEQVQIPQKTVRYRPIDKGLDGLLGILCGAKIISQSNITIRVALAVQQACGRTGCAEQSTIARTLQASTPETVAQLSRVSWYYLSALARPRTLGSPSACCGSMWMSPPCRLAPGPRAVSAPGWGATAAKPAAQSCAGPPARTRDSP